LQGSTQMQVFCFNVEALGSNRKRSEFCQKVILCWKKVSQHYLQCHQHRYCKNLKHKNWKAWEQNNQSCPRSFVQVTSLCDDCLVLVFLPLGNKGGRLWRASSDFLWKQLPLPSGSGKLPLVRGPPNTLSKCPKVVKWWKLVFSHKLEIEFPMKNWDWSAKLKLKCKKKKFM